MNEACFLGHMIEPFLGIRVNMRNTETSEIRILVYIHTYIHTNIDRPN